MAPTPDLPDCAVTKKAEIAKGRNSMCLHHDSSNPIIPPAGTCPFLRIPQELRDLVYDHALTNPSDHLICTTYVIPTHEASRIITRLHHSIFDIEDINQLQYVSRQLHAETSGLVSRLIRCIEFRPEMYGVDPTLGLKSLVRFVDSAEVAYARALIFLRACKHSTIANLNTVLFPLGGRWYVNVTQTRQDSPLHGLCSAYPHISFKLQFEHWWFQHAEGTLSFLRSGVRLEGGHYGYALTFSSNLSLMPNLSYCDESVLWEGIVELGLEEDLSQATFRHAKRWLTEGIKGGRQRLTEILRISSSAASGGLLLELA